MSSIEDIIRRIVREELAAYHSRVKLSDKYGGDTIRPVPRYDLPPFPDRMGCTCPPGRTSAACPDPTCPWKPR